MARAVQTLQAGRPGGAQIAVQRGDAGSAQPIVEPYYLSLCGRGMSTTAAFVALGRKLARVCFARLKNGTDFNPHRRSGACAAT